MKRKLLALLFILSAVFLVSAVWYGEPATPKFHSDGELEMLAKLSSTPIGPGDYFLTSASCRGCHGFDTLNQSNIDEDGFDVNLFDRWQGTMMANSAKDPLWRAKVSHEILINPAHANELQNKCTSCHAPMGHYNAFFKGTGPYLLSELVNDSLGLDGVSCAGCHTIGPNVGSTFSGEIPYDTTRHIYGPFTNPFLGPMQLYEGYTPTYSPHTDMSEMCSSCHTLITQTVDLGGAFTGGEFVEQATYHEYLNSSYPAANIKCQTCHMPQLLDPVVIANGFLNLPSRFPFNQHYFAGANQFMINLIKNNKTTLGISTPDASFDTALAATTRMLREQTADLLVYTDSIDQDTAYFRVYIKNKAGHKFPSGYPSRRAVLQFVVTDAVGDTIFRSGMFDSNHRVIGENASYEPHHTVINQSDVSQIYELVMGDVNGQFTSVLERASVVLKDNRIPPDGFTTTAPMYDTVTVSSDALADADFNQLNGAEGTGSDYVHFRVAHTPSGGINGPFNVYARLLYQSVPPKWTDEMFLLNSAEIDTFRNMFLGADNTPFQVAEDSVLNISTALPPHGNGNSVTVSSVSPDGTVTVTSTAGPLGMLVVYDRSGKKAVQVAASNQKQITLKLPAASGIYFLNVKNGNRSSSFKLLYNSFAR